MQKPIQKPRTSQSLRFFILRAVLGVASFSLIHCAAQVTPSVQLASEKISNSLGCDDVKSKMFDAFYEMIDQDQLIPNAKNLKTQLNSQLDQMVLQKKIVADLAKIGTLKIKLYDLVDALLIESQKNPLLTWKEQVQKLIEYEMEDQSTVAVKTSVQSINLKVQEIKALSQDLSALCTTAPASGTVQPKPPVESNGSAPSVGVASSTVYSGLNRVVATAYQSCRVLDLPPMDKSTPNVSGISRIGTHPDGIGGQRIISDLTAVQNTHYYVRGIASESNCSPVRNNPLIYDYGGEPFISGNTISFQQNAGTGTKVLGVDCSAFVSSSIAVAGLRYKPGVENKPIFIRQTSTKFIDAVQSGFSCFDNVTLNNKSSILPGDIVGVHGHVVAIDRIGDDPFGLKLLKSAADCSQINYKNFDISISQSSPSKNGIGINKYVVRDYLDEESKMKTAFVEMGRQACLAHFQNKSIKPSSADWGFLRHKGTPECLAPRVSIAGEACTRSCF